MNDPIPQRNKPTRRRRRFHQTRRWFLLLVVIVGISAPLQSVAAQQPEGAVYVVQEGDSLWEIAVRFRVSLDDLTKINNISNPGQLSVGAHLLIPGLEGIQGTLTTRTVGFGDNLNSLSRRYRLPVETLAQLNHLASPYELYVGASLVLLEENASIEEKGRLMLSKGQSLLELAVVNGTNPWGLAQDNKLSSLWSILPGEVLHAGASLPSEQSDNRSPSALPGAVQSIALKPSITVQGRTVVISIIAEQGATFSGALVDRPLHFYEYDDDSLLALQGIHVMTPPGLYSMTITGTLPADAAGNRDTFAFSQGVLVASGNYPFDPVLTVSPETIDPAVTAPEDAEWTALAAPVTPTMQWDGLFSSPIAPPFNDCWPSRFGNRRSYNGSAYIYFHSGLDFCGSVGEKILAPAAGTVIFAGPLTVRGNATMIDHGWGVYSAYMHQSEILVEVGDKVTPGQVIGLVGGTGRVTGPHLHWEVWVGGVQVDPLEWLQTQFP